MARTGRIITKRMLLGVNQFVFHWNINRLIHVAPRASSKTTSLVMRKREPLPKAPSSHQTPLLFQAHETGCHGVKAVSCGSLRANASWYLACAIIPHFIRKRREATTSLLILLFCTTDFRQALCSTLATDDTARLHCLACSLPCSY